MKEKIKQQEGVIQIPLLIGIIVFIIAVTGIGYMAFEHYQIPEIKSQNNTELLDNNMVEKETVLHIVPEDYLGFGISAAIFSPDGQRFAYQVSKDGKDFFVVDGIEQKKYDKNVISIQDAFFSSDSRYFIYETRIDEKNQFVVIDENGKEKIKNCHFPASYGLPLVSLDDVKCLSFTVDSGPDDERIIRYAVGDVIQQYVRYGDIDGPGACIVASPDGEGFAYLASDSYKSRGTSDFIVLNNIQGESKIIKLKGFVHCIDFYHKGNLVYVFNIYDKTVKNGSCSTEIYIERGEGPPLEIIHDHTGSLREYYPNLVFSDDGKNFAYIITKSENCGIDIATSNVFNATLVINGKEIEGFDPYHHPNMAFSPDGKIFVINHYDSGQLFLDIFNVESINEEGGIQFSSEPIFKVDEGKEYSVKELVVNSNGKTAVIYDDDSAEQYVIIPHLNKIIRNNYKQIENLRFSLDGKMLYFNTVKDDQISLMQVPME